MQIFDQILSWPVIIQGALGSGLFWLIIVVGQFVTQKSKNIFGYHREQAYARDEYLKEVITSDDKEGMIYYFNACVYVSLHYMVKASILITLGLSLSSVVPVFGIVGFVGGIIFLFLALRSCVHLDSYFEKYSKDESSKTDK